jgi:uncharacterized protein (DUF362 family)
MSASIKNDPKMNRREFVKTAAAGAAGLALMGLPAGRSEAAVQKYPHWGEVVIIRDESVTKGPTINYSVIESMLDDGIKAFTNGGGWTSLIPYKTGETVGIKVNCERPRMTTQPKVVGALVNRLVGIGIPANKIVVWDADSERMVLSEMMGLGFRFKGLRVMGSDKLENPFDESKILDIQGKPTKLIRLLTDADHLINVPVLKNHFEAGITFALKNNLGGAGNSNKYRQEIFHLPPEEGNMIHKFAGRGRPIAERIALLNTAPDIKNKTRLIVGDALFGVCTWGPGGEPEFAYNGLIIGRDPVATDHQVRLIMENERKKRNLQFVPSSHVDEAIKLGLGAPIDEMKANQINRTAKG